MNKDNMKRDYYFTLRGEHGINFVIDTHENLYTGSFVKKVQLWQETLVKMAESLNHFLEYLYRTDAEGYEFVGMHLFKINLDIKRDIGDKLNLEELKKKPDFNTTYLENRLKLIEKYFDIDERLLKYICKYVEDNTLHNVVEKEGTNLTLRQIDCQVLHVLSVVIKLLYLYVGDIRSDMKFEECVNKYLDRLMIKVTGITIDYFGEDMTVDHVNSHIHTFMSELYKKQWNKNALKFIDKFSNCGISIETLVNNAKNKVFTALRKYTPLLKNVEEGDYCEYVDRHLTKEDTTQIYWTIDKKYDDFGLISKSLTAYIQAIIESICRSQDSQQKLPMINIPEFSIEMGEETTMQKEQSMYFDKKKFMYERVKEDTKELFMSVVSELNKYSDENMMDDINAIMLNKDHMLNQTIYSRVLLAITGDCRVFMDQLGVMGKFVLYLFQRRLFEAEDLDFFRDIALCMSLEPTKIYLDSEENVERAIEVFEIEGVTSKEFIKLIPVYNYPSSEETLNIPISDMIDFYAFISNPSRIRNLMFPHLHEIIEDENVNDITYVRTKLEDKVINKVLTEVLI